MEGNREQAGQGRRLLVAKGSFESFGGAERDLIRNLPALSEAFEVTVATLAPVSELENMCSELGVSLLYPENTWKMPVDPVSRILDIGSNSATKAWKSCSRLGDAIDHCDAVHLVSGDGSLELLDMIPQETVVHFHLLEPHRGLHEDVLHMEIDGRPKRSLRLTHGLLTKARNADLRAVRKLAERPKSAISGNSNFTASRIVEIYGVDAGVLHPSVVTDEFPELASANETMPNSFSGDYVVSVGRASWVKGTWETISMLGGTNLILAHVGGGDKDDLDRLSSHARNCGVELWIAPRLSSNEMAALMRGARAVVSMAHGEPFGLTPIEAFSVGTPALFVDEGGFRDSIVDGKNGRLLARDDIEGWHSNLEMVKDSTVREQWSKAGKDRISELGLSPENHCSRLLRILDSIHDDE
jgi:glycosyltransferase involved in cell wall biosynthesis|tara:strand:- start:31465 stop:32703 length:1239 start_codon:yes stop_codon:yes gene_type:complete